IFNSIIAPVSPLRKMHFSMGYYRLSGGLFNDYRGPVLDYHVQSFKLSIGNIGITSVPLYTNEAIAGFIPKDNYTFDEHFLYYALHKINYIENIDIAVKGKTLNKKKLNELEISLPPIKEQQKIAAILSSVDEAIEKTEQIIEQTEKVKKGLMQQLLTKGIGHIEFKKSAIGEIPKNWEVGMLEDYTVTKPEYGASASAVEFSESLPRYIRITDITNEGTLNEADPKSIQIESNEKYLLEEGDILFARTGNTVGKTYLYTANDGQAIYAGYLIRFKLNSKLLLPRYLFHLTHSGYYYNWVKSMLRTGAQPNINAKEYSSLLVTVPPIEEQKEIVSILDSFIEKIKTEKEKLSKLTNLKHGLMQQLLTGKVRVPIDDEEGVKET
ncbi:restriction endonuclease subunit S, partial [Lentibacillus lipolyticus]